MGLLKLMNRQLNKIYNLLERIDTRYQDYVLLTESQESKSISAAKKLVMQRFGWDEARADEFIRKVLRHDFSVLHHNSKAGKFILGLTRMFCDNQLRDGGIIQQLNNTIELVASDAHINEYDRNLNGMSADELIDRFATARKEMGDKDREEINSMEYQENNDYTIVQIDSFEQSSQYGKYTSWCVTHNENMLDSYTSDGIGQFYFCLKNGFENVPQKQGEGCPLDEYGLSMVAVSVDGDGNLSTCTCRWNHDNGGNDHIMGTKQISQLIGRNFYEVFKPNDKWQKAVSSAMQRLENGEDPKRIFQTVERFDDARNLYRVKLCNRFNVINKNGKILSPNQWFDWVEDYFEEGFVLVRTPGYRWNYLSKNGNLLSNEWFDAVDDFNEGCGLVQKNEKYNFINSKGKLMSNEWFDEAEVMHNGLSRVYKNEKYNFFKNDGTYLFNEWYDYMTQFYCRGFTIIANSKNEKFNIGNTIGEILSPVWYNDINYMNVSNMLRVTNCEKQSLMSTEGQLLIPNQWFDELTDISYTTSNPMFLVKLNKKYNVINGKGDILYDKWYDSFETRNDGDLTAVVKYNDSYCLIEKDTGKQLSPWFGMIIKSNAYNCMFAISKDKTRVFELDYKGNYKLINTPK